MTQDELKVGDYVSYCPKYGNVERGRVKAIPEHTKDAVFVVYHCNNEWQHFQDYTGQLTNISDLKRGWV